MIELNITNKSRVISSKNDKLTDEMKNPEDIWCFLGYGLMRDKNEDDEPADTRLSHWSTAKPCFNSESIPLP